MLKVNDSIAIQKYLTPSILFLLLFFLFRDREVVAVAMNLFDRFFVVHRNTLHSHEEVVLDGPDDDTLASSSSSCSSCRCHICNRIVDSRTYQLAAMTSLYLAIKLRADDGNQHIFDNNTTTSTRRSTANHSCLVPSRDRNSHRNKRTFKLDAFVELSRGQFVAKDICSMEQAILLELRWQVHPPTPMMFCSYMLATLMPTTHGASGTSQSYHATTTNSRIKNRLHRYELVLHVVRELSRYLTELAVCLERECFGKPPSHIAFCAIVASMNLLTVVALPLSIRESFYERTTTILLFHDTTTTLSEFHQENTQLQAVLLKAVGPELLMDNLTKTTTATPTDSSSRNRSTSTSTSARLHPISLAREYGLLDMDRMDHDHSRQLNRPTTADNTSNRKSIHHPQSNSTRFGIIDSTLYNVLIGTALTASPTPDSPTRTNTMTTTTSSCRSTTTTTTSSSSSIASQNGSPILSNDIATMSSFNNTYNSS
jgi:Cyclin, N-terminal domain